MKGLENSDHGYTDPSAKQYAYKDLFVSRRFQFADHENGENEGEDVDQDVCRDEAGEECLLSCPPLVWSVSIWHRLHRNRSTHAIDASVRGHIPWLRK